MYQLIKGMDLIIKMLFLLCFIQLLNAAAVIELTSQTFKKEVLGKDNTYFVSLIISKYFPFIFSLSNIDSVWYEGMPSLSRNGSSI